MIFRVAFFFVGSIFLLVTILPWNSPSSARSPYVSALERMGIPAAAEIMNAVVLVAVLSCLNSGLYTASRMLFVLAARQEAPRRMLGVNRRGVPMLAILASTLVGFLCVIAAYLSPDPVFLFLLNSSGAIILFVYLMIGLSQLRMRRTLERTAPERLQLKMWFYPVLTLRPPPPSSPILVAMFVREDTRSQIVLSLLAWAVVLGAYAVLRRIAGPAVVEAHLTEQGLDAEQRADAWMHEHGVAAELEVEAAVGEGPLPRDLVRRADEEAYSTQGP